MYDLSHQLQAVGSSVFVFVDSRDSARYFDQKQSFKIWRFTGPKCWRRWRKAKAIKRFLKTDTMVAILTDSWKSVALLQGLETLPVLSLVHGNECLTTDPRKQQRIREISQQVTLFIANSNATAALIEQLGIPKIKIQTVYPGITPVQLNNKASIPIKTHSGPLLLTVGRLEPRKGHQQVISALALLQTQYPTLQYTIVGQGHGSYLRQLKQQVKRLGLESRVHFLGAVDSVTLASLYQQADCFIMPVFEDHVNQSIEGFGLVYLEAAFYGTPAIAGHSGGAKEAVMAGKTGWVCKDQSPESLARLIDTCLSDPQQLTVMGKRAQARVQSEFLWPVAIQRYLKVIEKTARTCVKSDESLD